MSNKYQGSQASKDTREVKDLVPAKPVPPTFASRADYEGFQVPILNAFHAGLLPDTIKTEQAAIVVALKGRELGLEPMYALSTIYLVHGKPALEGEAMLGLVLRKYPQTPIRWVERTHQKAVLEMGRPGSTQLSQFTFTVEDALRAGMITKINPDGSVVAARGKEVWAQYTRKMLSWRAVSEAITLLFPECIQGCLLPEELKTPVDPGPQQVIPVTTIDAEFGGAPEKGTEIHETKAPTAETLDAELVEPPEPAFEPLPFEKKQAPPIAEIYESAPKDPVGMTRAMPPKTEYVFQVGMYTGKKVSDLPRVTLEQYVKQLGERQVKKGHDAKIQEMIDAIKKHLG